MVFFLPVILDLHALISDFSLEIVLSVISSPTTPVVTFPNTCCFTAKLLVVFLFIEVLTHEDFWFLLLGFITVMT